jgi:putative DNA primase/helicase
MGGPITGYMERKKIADHYGTGTAPDSELNPSLVIPMRDIEGDIWNLQRIFDDGNKRPLTGGRISGLMHIIGGSVEKEAYICEGYSTGASIYLATQKPVVVAFNCHNLVKVAVALSDKYPNAKLTICGDDDAYGEKNAGRECAEEAAEASMAGTIFPKFKNTENNPTDFNDLHCNEGLGSVSDQIVGKKTEPKNGFIPLGYDGDANYFYAFGSRDTVKLTTFSKPQLYALAPQSYWRARFAPPETSKISMDNVINHLVSISRMIGPFDRTRIRGTGVWDDDGRIVLNTGSDVLVNGEPLDESWRIYVQTIHRMPPLAEPLTVAECKPLLDVCQAIKWVDPKNGPFLAGWLAVARIAGALPIRPHIWLTGGAGTGKSTVMQMIERALGGEKGRISVLGATTEAGIRQRAKCSALPMVFDEFETTDIKSSERIKSIIELLRSSWSATQGSVIKGSGDGSSQEYTLNFCALVSSIRVNLTNDADRSRFCILELAKHGNNENEFKRLLELFDAIDVDFGCRLFARMVKQAANVIKSQDTLRAALAARFDQRFGQQVGTLLAGYHALTSDESISKDRAMEYAWGIEVERDDCETDALELLNHVMTTKITAKTPAGFVDITLGEAAKLSGYGDVLRNYGIIVKDDSLYISTRHAELRKILEKTRWAENWSRTFLRIDGAKAAGATRFGGAITKATVVPMSAI